MARIFNVLVVLRVIKVDISDAGWVLFSLRILCSILKFAHGEAFELHHILRQCARLVAEDVMHHSELLVQVGRLDRRLHSRDRITDIDILRDVVRLDEIDHFERHEQ